VATAAAAATTITAATTPATVATNLPKEFVDRILADNTIPNPQGLLDALASGEPSVAIRHNRGKGCAPAEDAQRVPWCARGEYLAERPNFTLDPAFHQGCYYVQDPSSMAIGAVVESLGLDAPVCLLDACAAPGGKTTAAIDALPTGSFVLANEFDGQRAGVLRDNLIKWGYDRVAVSRGDTALLSRLGREVFDVVIADVPCSGEGMMRKDSHAVEQWTPGLVRSCAALQREILENLWPLLRPGGYLIYGTCTFAHAEDEEQIEWLQREFDAEPVALPELPGVVAGHFYPHLVRGEGLYLAVVRKPGELRPTGGKINLKKLPGALFTEVEQYELKGRDRIPTHAWAMQANFPRGSFPEVEVDRHTALLYLHRDAVTLPPDTPRGYVLLTYGGRPLGFVKNLGNRANNLYPKHLRILQNID
jgi:16S rRNA C967 or C1407 C5-methylase (RsmB/RsmF family)